MDPSLYLPLADALRAAADRTPAEAMRRVLPDPNLRRDPAIAVYVLLALGLLLDEGADPARVWALRDRLSVRYGHPGPRWQWSFDHLKVRDAGWRTDLALWAACKAHVPEARALDPAAHAARSARFLRTLADTRTAWLAAGTDAAPLTAALFEVFAQRPAPAERRSANAWRPPRQAPQRPPGLWMYMAQRFAHAPAKHTGAELGRTARGIAHALLAPPRDAEGDALLAAYTGWLVAAHGGDTRALETLALLHDHGVPDARPALAGAAVAAEGWSHVQRADALHHLLAHAGAPTETEPE